MERLNAVAKHVNHSFKLTPTKAVICGAAGGIGQTLSLLLKLDPLIDEVALYDPSPNVLGK